MSGYPLVRCTDGHPVVALDADHPGVADPLYRARRDAIAGLALAWTPGTPVPDVAYTPGEDATWAAVCAGLLPLWRERAATVFLDGVEAIGLPRDRVPQLSEVTAALRDRTGFEYRPVAGLAPLRTFYEAFGAGVFWSTQYMRHGSRPLYTPEPDVCHEVLGHAHHLADPGLAGVYRSVARAAARTRTEEALRFLSRVFWRTLEFGVVREAGMLKAYGAGLLSSVGELRSFADARVLDVDWAAMGTRPYDIARFQEELYCAPSPAWLAEDLPGWFDAYDDDVWAVLASSSGTRSATERTMRDGR
ncbi:hypothetical protein K6U06_13590 [Acidiferrimicrobium sp. IK]|uniref:hypothetical protein n=1 Tax=Acidiferrimicrobium sp. IK TaxID=2871700 RepID=UPI0021CB2759|nr:hypothetical protein [Acidiferrimicrobium sp. IK]MCU4185400.1 hypothetical protein [Acidiferrimicrobium sp. IK]